MKTTGKITSKPYKCKLCGYEENHSTNHWGEFYNTHCKGCGQYSPWECMEDPPKGYVEPSKWQTVMLSDLLVPKEDESND